MPRIADTERIQRLLNSEGGSLGRREIIEALGLSDARYHEVAQQLVAKGGAIRNRGRTGGLRLAAMEPARRPEVGRGPAGPRLERDLYPPFENHLLAAAAKEDVSKSVVLSAYRTRAAKWETPDLVEVRVTPFPMIGQWELRVVTYELKRQGAWTVESVLQAASYNEFAHESWLVVPAGEDGGDGDWADYFGKGIVTKAGDFGVGLGTFDAQEETFQKHMHPHSARVPLLSRLHDWLDQLIERIDEEKKRTEIAANIRWARDKANSGRD